MDNNQSPQSSESGETFDVLFRGEILPGSDMKATREQVAKSFKLDGAALDRLFSGSVISLKRNIDRETAERIFQRLYSAGAMAKIVPSLPRQADLEKESPPDSKPFTVAPLGADVLEGSAVGQPPLTFSTERLEHLEIEPTGSNIIEESEREQIEPVEVNIDHLSLE